MALTRSDSQDSRSGGARRRAEDFPVRQWLKLGAASAGLGAALLGFSLLGPEAACVERSTVLPLCYLERKLINRSHA